MSTSVKQAGKADVGGERTANGPVGEAIPATKPTGQKVSLERGKATHKKNPGKRPKAGGS